MQSIQFELNQGYFIANLNQPNLPSLTLGGLSWSLKCLEAAELGLGSAARLDLVGPSLQS